MSDNSDLSAVSEDVGLAPSGGAEGGEGGHAGGKKEKREHKKDHQHKSGTSSLQLLSASSKKDKKDKKEKKEKETRYSHLGNGSSGDERDQHRSASAHSTEAKSPAKSKLRAKPLVLFGSAKKDKSKHKEKRVDDSQVSGAGAGGSSAFVDHPPTATEIDGSFNPFYVKNEKHAGIHLHSGKKEKSSKLEKKMKLKKSCKHQNLEAEAEKDFASNTDDLSVFGVDLELAVQRSKCHDGVCLPMVVRQCIDHIEEHGLMVEGVYRSSGVKSKISKLRAAFNSGHNSKVILLSDYEPAVVASVLKQFLRELPSPVLTHSLMPKFESVSADPNPQARIQGMRTLIQMLPECNRTLLRWIFLHMSHVIEHQKFNKMTLQNVSIVLSPTMTISHRVLNCLFENIHVMSEGGQIKKYVPPITGGSDKVILPETPDLIKEEIFKQESLLGDLHLQISSGAASKKTEESLWEQQRIVTQLKRKLRSVSLQNPTMETMKKYEPIDYEEELDFRLQQMSVDPPAEEETVLVDSPVNPSPSSLDAEVVTVSVENVEQMEPDTDAPADVASSQKAGEEIAKAKEQHKVKVVIHERVEESVSKQECQNDPKESPMQDQRGNVTVIQLYGGNNDETDAAKVKIGETGKVGEGSFPLLPKPPCRENKTRSKFSSILQPTLATTNPVVSSNLDVKSDAVLKSKSLPRGHHPWPTEGDGGTDGSKDETFPNPEEDKMVEGLQLQLLRLKFENEELESLRSELEWRKKSERKEMEELRDEMATMQTLYQYRTYSVDSSESSENENDKNVKDAREQTEKLERKLVGLMRDNNELESKRLALCEKIQQERSACIRLRVEIKVEQERRKMMQPVC